MTTTKTPRTRNTSTRNGRTAAKRESIIASFNVDKLHGEIITWSAKADTAHTHKSVVAALQAAKLDDSVARELLPRYAFSRASKKLADERIIDILREESDTITFQFSRKIMIDGNEWAYPKETNLALNKTTGKIGCDLEALRQHAQNELDRCMEERTTSDITKIVQKLFERHADLVPVRDQGGVYFVPIAYASFIDQIKVFLEDQLGGRINRWPIPAGTAAGDKAVQESMAEYLNGLVKEHNAAMDNFTTHTRPDTIKSTAEKINATRVKMEAYANYLQERREDLLDAVEKARLRLLRQVEQITEDRKNAPPTEDGGGRRGHVFGNSATSIVRWMGLVGWTGEQALQVMAKLGHPMSENTVRSCIGSGRKQNWTHGEPAKLSSEQIAQLEKLRDGV